MKKIILASASPRRRELLRYITEDFDVRVSSASEDCDAADPRKLVMELAKRKAEDVFSAEENSIVIGSDTVVYAAGRILGKPEDEREAREFIELLRGKKHSVYTGVHIVSKEKSVSGAERTDVFFSDMTDGEITDYLSRSDWQDKAGGYAIQGAAARYITGIEGCYYNVMGFPVSLAYGMLKKFRL